MPTPLPGPDEERRYLPWRLHGAGRDRPAACAGTVAAVGPAQRAIRTAGYDTYDFVGAHPDTCDADGLYLVLMAGATNR